MTKKQKTAVLNGLFVCLTSHVETPEAVLAPRQVRPELEVLLTGRRLVRHVPCNTQGSQGTRG